MRPRALMADNTPGDKSPSFSPSARESASKCRERTAACSGDTLTPGDGIPPSGLDDGMQPSSLSAPSQTLASASHAPAVTADVTEGPEGGAGPDLPLEEPRSHIPAWLRRRIGQDVPPVVAPPVTRASGAHLEPVGQHKLDDDAKIPEFLRQHGVTSLATHAQPIASDRKPSEGSQADQPSRFVPRILREAGLVTFPVTPSQAPPASVTPTVPAAPIAGSVCPTCRCRVPARLTPAERQRAYRTRKREKSQGLAKGD